jgi:hypothetical protein
MAVTGRADAGCRLLSAAVDPVFYRTVYPYTAELGWDAVEHYRALGWRQGRDPAAWFSTEAYLQAHADVRAEGLEPLSHYLAKGHREGREVSPSKHATAYFRKQGWAPPRWRFEGPGRAGATHVAAAPPPVLEEERAVIEGEFDAPYYLAANPDVAAAGVDPLWHFLVAGWREGRDPSARFSVRDYLEISPDVAAAGANPFVHYLRTGRAEGRAARLDLGFRYHVVARLPPPSERLDRATAAAQATATLPGAALADGLATARTGLKDLHVTFSHDDYLATFGGVQLSLRRESERFAAMGVDHLHLYPAAPWTLVRRAGEPGPLGVRLNGRRLGVYSPRTVRERLARAAAEVPAGRRSFAIHSLLGHSARESASILSAVGLQAGYFWLHDFASLCAGFHLLRNEVEDCGAPPPDSAACALCSNGPYRARHLDAHTELFERLQLTVVAPSETTLRFWQESWRYAAKEAVVLPHARLVERGPAAPPARSRRPLRVAFAGMPSVLKGWPIFRELAQQFQDDPRYEFLHLGGRREPLAPVAFHEVVASEHRPAAMRDALEALEADVALIWPICRETFSFTAYEAAAAGAAVITGPDSGNVAAFVAESGHGRVLPSEQALFQLFHTGEGADLARRRRGARLYDIAFSGLTADLVQAAG